MAGLNQLDGTNGFRLGGIDAGDQSGVSVAGAGDVNGDGIDDLIIGAPGADPGDRSNAGESYVVFGTDAGFDASLDLAALDGTDGFRLDGIDNYDNSGRSVAGAGDLNGDGIDDLIIGAPGADPGDAGETYVVFGTAGGFSASLDLAALDGTDGFRLDGIDNYDNSGVSVAGAGDVNGDGIDDLIIGAPGADPGDAGETYVVFGTAGGFSASLDLAALDGTDGFRLDGIDNYDNSGRSVAGAGDVNGDGIDDLIIGALGADPGDRYDAGESYVVFGTAGGFSASLDLAALDGTDGFRLDGIDNYDNSGRSVAGAGDVNGDGIDDLIIGALGADPGDRSNAGESYVVFGTEAGFDASLDLAALDGTDGFRLDGIDNYDASGISAAGAGDVNGDGFDDLIIGASSADADGSDDAGESYVVFGSSAGFGASFDLSALNGTNGFRLDGIEASDLSGASAAAAGDVNSDGIDDLIVGAQGASPDGRNDAGESYVIFGSTQLGGANDAPLAQDDALEVRTLERVDLAADNGAGADRDPDFDDLTISMIDGVAVAAGDAVTLASGLRVTFVGGSEVTFDLPGAVIGTEVSDSFAYEISDGRGGSDAATATVDFTQDALDLASLDGASGFRLDGAEAYDRSGSAVAGAGDINGDGFDDIIVGAPDADGNGIYSTGENYVVFGAGAGFAADLDVAALDGSNGFRLDGIDAYDISGRSVAGAGDLNGDGIDDLIIGAPGGDPARRGNAGESCVIFGSTSGFGPTFDLSSLNGTNGFRIDGVDRYDGIGFSVAGAGDVNGDGIDDLIVGGPYAGGDGTYSTGESYVVFGSSVGFSATFDLATLDGSNGFRLEGLDNNDASGTSVAGAGDVNGDGIDDIIVGAPGGDPDREGRAGESYVVFGTSAGFAASVDLGTLDGSNGFRLDGAARDDESGTSVAPAGDLNGDGIDDLIVGARRADADGRTDAGASYVVFGTDEGFAPRFDLSALDGTNGFRLTGVDTYDESGFSVSGAGDFNGDGINDLIVGAPGGDAGAESDTGESYVVFGSSAGFAASLDLSSLEGTDGFRLIGIDASDRSGSAVAAAGDVNSDGFDDLIIGAPSGDADGKESAGESYIVFGFDVDAAQKQIFGGPHRDMLAGTDGDEGFHLGGGLDRVTTGAGADTILFNDRVGTRDVLRISDFDPLLDEPDLQGASIAETVEHDDRTVPLLDGSDQDRIVLHGLSESPFDLLI